MWYSSSRSAVPVTSNPQNRVAFGFSAIVREEQNDNIIDIIFKTKKAQTCSSKKQSRVCVILSIFLSIYKLGLKKEGQSE